MNTNDPAFTPTAVGYDTIFSHTTLGQQLRQRVWQLTTPFVRPSDRVLEINCGTGEDALWLQARTTQVWATDQSEAMLTVARQKSANASIAFAPADAARLTTDLQAAGFPTEGYDLIWSNFGGLNCLSPTELTLWAEQATTLLAPNGRLVLVVMGRFCLWESLYFSWKGQWGKAKRRWHGGPVRANLDGVSEVDTWYYSPQQLRALFPQDRQVALFPVGIALPPSYLEPFFRRFPRLLGFLGRVERLLTVAPMAYVADHFCLVLEQ
jgi:SAM-dependent methyltransferase